MSIKHSKLQPHILIVDDDLTNRKVLEYKLKKNFKTTSAKSGQEAIDLVQKMQFDLILMDLQMPGISGIEATNIIRNKHLFNKKIIAVTGHSFDSDFYANHGFDDVLLKPIDFNKLESFLYHFLE
ncbi:CheY-like superfamily [Zopfochytrium polystomum]|nr:CheY-like superfamily [Zopfochytrium polystomum]